eukprot:EG_transcript_5139
MNPGACCRLVLLLYLLVLITRGVCGRIAVGALSLSGDPLYLRVARPWLRPANAVFFGSTEVRGLALVNCSCARTEVPCWTVCALRHLLAVRPAQDWYVVVAETSFVFLPNLEYQLQLYAPDEPWAVADFSRRLNGRPPPAPTDADFRPAPCGVAFSRNATAAIVKQAPWLALERLPWGRFFRTLAHDVGVALDSSDAFLCSLPFHAEEADEDCHRQRQSPPRCTAGVPNPVVYRPAVVALGPREQFASLGRTVLRRLRRADANTSAVCGPTYCSLCSGSAATGAIRQRQRALERHHCRVGRGVNRTLWTFMQDLVWRSSGRRSTPVRLVDVLLFTTEVDMLQVRLYETFEAVDVVVLMESNMTFQGQPRPLVFPPWRHHPRFARYSSKIRHLTFHPTQQCRLDPWACELDQRTQSVHRAGLRPADLVLVTDADELVGLDTMRRLRDCNHLTPIALDLTFHYYSVGLHRHGAVWQVPAYNYRQAMRVTGLGLRRVSLAETVIPAAGWHFSYFGGPGAIRQKLLSFSHTEYSQPPYTNLAHIERCLRQGADLFNRSDHRWVPAPPPRLPALLRDRPCDFPAFFDPLDSGGQMGERFASAGDELS